MIKVMPMLLRIKTTEQTFETSHNSNRGQAKKLVVSYCFPPYVDTSGNVMAKRIRKMNEIVDVIYNKMEVARDKDEQLNVLVDDMIDTRFEVPSTTSFSSWKGIYEFYSLGMAKIGGRKYEEVYSRALWPGSHFLAYIYKINNPDVKWTAEFSDPILLDIHGKKRESKIQNKQFLKQAHEIIRKEHNLPAVGDKNLFFWCEYLAYLFADEIIFTNKNQLKYMMDNFPVQSIRQIIKEKAIISPHPTLSKEFYHIKKSQYKIDEEKVNVAYFGNFYSTRNLDELFLGLKKLNNDLRSHIRLHIFTSDPSLLKKELSSQGLDQNVYINPFVNFNEFLNLTTIFNCLIVNDAKTKGFKEINPYLPSKLSDYLGSRTPIWGIYEKGSILSEYELEYKSELGDINEAAIIYEKLVKKKISPN